MSRPKRLQGLQWLSLAWDSHTGLRPGDSLQYLVVKHLQLMTLVDVWKSYMTFKHPLVIVFVLSVDLLPSLEASRDTGLLLFLFASS